MHCLWKKRRNPAQTVEIGQWNPSKCRWLWNIWVIGWEMGGLIPVGNYFVDVDLNHIALLYRAYYQLSVPFKEF